MIDSAYYIPVVCVWSHTVFRIGVHFRTDPDPVWVRV